MDGCCDSGDGRFSVLPPNPTTSAIWNDSLTQYVVVSTSTSSASTYYTTITTSTTAPASTQLVVSPETLSEESSGNSLELSKSAKAGIGAGVGVGAILVLALSYLIWRLRMTKALLAHNQADEPVQPALPITTTHKDTSDPANQQSHGEELGELGGSTNPPPQELSGI